MDGSPSAPDFVPESLDLPAGHSRPSDTERELDELRARAYGPQADIDADPAAIARLVELEAAHATAAAITPGSAQHATAGVEAPRGHIRARASPAAEPPVRPPPRARPAEPVVELRSAASGRGSRPWLPQRARGMRRGTRWLIASTAVVAVCFAVATTSSREPRPDASLPSLKSAPDSEIVGLLDAHIDHPELASFRQFASYHGVDVWSVETAEGDICLVVWDYGRSGRFASQCVPPRIDAAVFLGVGPVGDGFGRWLPEGSILSFHLRENTVDVFVDSETVSD